MKPASMRYIFPQALKSIFHNGWMTIAAILTISISLFLCIAFWLVIINVDANATKVEGDVRIVAYLKEGTTEEEIEILETRIANLDGVAEVEFTSKDEGIASLGDRFGGVDLVETLGGSNPLPDLFSVMAKDATDVIDIVERVEAMSAVDVVRYGEGTVENLFALTDTMRKIGFAAMALMGFAAIVLIAMTIKLTVMARKKEIMVMKWVGATNAFIRLPFFIEGLLLGLLGALIALGLVLLMYAHVYDYLVATISFVVVLNLSQVWLTTTIFAVTAGIVLGSLGSIIPLTRFLDV